MPLTSSDISNIGTSASNLGASIISKSGSAKDRASAERVAMEGTKQSQNAIEAARIQSKQSAKDSKSSNTKIIYWSVAGVVLFLIMVVVYIKFIRKR